MDGQRKSSDLVPEIAAAIAVVLVLLVAVLSHTDIRLALLAVAPLLVARGWMWTTREHGRVKERAQAEQAKLRAEKAQVDKLLDAALRSPGGRSVETDIAG